MEENEENGSGRILYRRKWLGSNSVVTGRANVVKLSAFNHPNVIILRDQLWWACREWLRTDTGAMLPPDELLIEELQAPTYEVQNGKIRVMKKNTMRELLKRSPDRADALCLTFARGGFLSDCSFLDFPVN